MRTALLIRCDGTVESVGDIPIKDQLGLYQKRRVSRILPMNLFKRSTFVFLRALFGDNGKVAKWTRTWGGGWQARILSTGETYCAPTRKACLEWEHELLERKMEKE